MLRYIYICAVICSCADSYTVPNKQAEDTYMNGTAEKDIFKSGSPIGDEKDSHFTIGYGTVIFIIVTLAVIFSAISVYAHLLPKALYGSLVSSARSYVGSFNFDGTPSDLFKSVSSLSADELIWTLILFASPVIIFRKQLIYAFIFVRTYFLVLGLGLVLSADVGTYGAAAVSVSSAASLSVFVYAAYSALRFGDLIHTNSASGIFSATVKFTLKILSALGCYVITEILILLPSAFI